MRALVAIPFSAKLSGSEDCLVYRFRQRGKAAPKDRSVDYLIGANSTPRSCASIRCFFLLVGSSVSSIAQALATSPTLAVGIDICLHKGHSNEQYRNKLTQLGAAVVPKEQRLLSEDPNSKEEWRFTLNGISYLTAFRARSRVEVQILRIHN